MCSDGILLAEGIEEDIENKYRVIDKIFKT
jgi:hypothetical protein